MMMFGRAVFGTVVDLLTMHVDVTRVMMYVLNG